jgi:Fic family protein
MQDIFKRIEDNKKKIDSIRPLSKESLLSLRNYYKIGLTYTSNALEGNSLTESETKVVVEDGLTVAGKPLKDIYEAVGHSKAYDFLYDIVNNKQITEEDIKKLHYNFYYLIDKDKAGEYRKEKVFISGSKYSVAKVEDIEKDMQDFVVWFNEREREMNPIEKAAITHLKFIFIHPFIDGNGRVARLLMNLSLLKSGYSIAIIPPIVRSEYISLLELSHKDPRPFIDFIAQREEQTQLELIRLLK